MNRIAHALILGLFGGLLNLNALTSGLAQAEPRLSLSSELSGTRQVMQMLGPVNLKRSELKANQSLQDILESKNQLYRQDSLLAAPVSATTSVTGNVRYQRPLKQAPHPNRMPYQR
ncbi:hypothetical protein [Vampirovibrio sp.]|uniref:hypothetical protein n=1 Tax=Vampirovibrio sp. TaxID=2717857 RepID=UPI0035942F75